jgi:hypothetical protein
MRAPLLSVLALSLATCAACGSGGSSSGSSGDPNDPNAPGGAGTGTPGTTSGGTSGGEVAKDLAGVWTVTGKDARGAYHGQAEVRSEGGKLSFVRTVQYDGVKVEDGRDLHWAFTGIAKGDTTKELTVDVVLENRGFIVEAGGLERKATDAPIAVTGKVKLEAGKGTATWSGTGVTGDETWTAHAPSSAAPLLVIDRTVTAGHGAPSAAVKSGFFSTYATYHALPLVQPYVARPEFQAAVHGFIVDKTDFAFYRANKNALRVIDKSIDAISLAETRVRANAYRSTLAEKARGFDDEIEAEFIDPQTGMLLDAAAPGVAKTVHFSAALWTGIYLASQIYRLQATGDVKAKANVLRSLDGVLELQEVTGDWSQFARAIRPATGTLQPGWHTGAGALSNLEWIEGGNNDMMKGLYISYVLAHDLLCKAPGYESLCTRIRTNAKHLSDDVNVDRGSDDLDSAWLTAVVTNDAVTRLTYQGKAQAAWLATKPVIQANTHLYDQGIADWSGLNLGFVANAFHMALADAWDVGGNGKATYRKIVEDTWTNLEQQHLPLWNLLHAAYGTSGTAPQTAEDVLWRMREMPFPKAQIKVDHRIRPDFCLSPYPSLPWKNDWTTTDRSQGLHSVPLFEEALDIYRFRMEMKYRGDSSAARPPAPEYLIAYWFGRKNAAIAATE